MQTIETIMDFVNELNMQNGSNHKKAILNEWKDNEDIKWFLQFYFDPFSVTNISTKKLQKKVSVKPARKINTFKELIEFVLNDCTGKDTDIATINYFINQDEHYREFVHGIISKTIRLGITSTTVNKVFGEDFIFKVKLQLASRYQENIKHVSGHNFTLTLKLDGIRCIAMKRNGKVTLVSRQGKPILEAIEIVEELENLDFDNFVFDGELLIKGWKKLPSKEAYKQTSKIVGSDGVKTGIELVVFDMVNVHSWDNKLGYAPYTTRRKCFRKIIKDCEFFSSVPRYYSGNELSKIDEILEKVKSYNQEGLMLNLNEAPYAYTRTRDILKVKVMQEVDLKVTGVQEGNGKYKGTTGALLVKYKGNTVRVGSGISDKLRDKIWKNQRGIIGRVISVQYFEETNDANGKKSLRFPVFKEIRPKGKEVSYN